MKRLRETIIQAVPNNLRSDWLPRSHKMGTLRCHCTIHSVRSLAFSLVGQRRSFPVALSNGLAVTFYVERNALTVSMGT